MIEVPQPDEQIKTINEWIKIAGKSLICFYNEERGQFWLDTFSMEANDSAIHPTATNRSFFALYEYLRFLHEEGMEKSDEADKVAKILKGVAEKYLAKLPMDPVWVRQSADNNINMFTDGHLLISISLLEGLRRIIQIDIDVAEVKNIAQKIAEENIQKLREWNGGRANPKDEVHDFITLFTVRGLDIFLRQYSCITDELINSLRDRVREDILRLLAFHYASVSSRFDAAELTFSIVLLNRLTHGAPQITERSIHTIIDSQEHDGGWPTARLISYEGRAVLHVASYEVALALTHLLIRKLYDEELYLCDLILPALNGAFKLVKSHYNEVDDKTGWANDHTRHPRLLESWSTAMVLTFLIHYRDALCQLRQYRTLKQYNTAYYISSNQIQTWPEMIPAFRMPDWIELNRLDLISDPTDNAAIIHTLKTEVVQPIGDNWIHRPQVASLILYGPPGARKTTLSHRIAQALGWPLLTLSPPYFLRRSGLEGVEACAAEIFDDLLHLRRVLVLFDECEDFFKARPKDQKIESRTIGAFITAGMLPRLQTLRDQRWIIFILATNSQLEDLDEAVMRPGRFDYAQEISYPTYDAQRRYVRGKIGRREIADVIVAALEQYDHVLRAASSSTAISFAHLDNLIKHINAMNEDPSESSVSEVLNRLLQQKGPRSLT